MKKLKEENKVLKEILNSLSEGIVVTNKDGNFIFINSVAANMVGVSSENVKPNMWSSAYGAYHLDKVTLYDPNKLPLARAIRGEVVNHEVIFIMNKERPDGIYIEVSASPLKSKKGTIEGGIIIIRDVTRHFEIEISLNEKEKRFKDVFNKFPIPSYLWKQVKDDFVLIDYNIAAEVITRGKIRNLVGSRFSKMYKNSPNLNEMQSNFAHCIEKKGLIRSEMTYKFQSTNELKDLVVSYVFVDPDLILVHTEDITKRKSAEAELRKLSSAVEQTADSVVITDPDGIIEYVNPGFEKITGFNKKEVIGQTPRILKSGKHDRVFYEKLWHTIQKGKTFRGRIINKKKNNELFRCEQTITPMKDKDGNIIKYVSVLKDMTATMEKENQKLMLKISQNQAKKLKDIDELKSRFFTNISHEFRTPLTLILGPSESIVTNSKEEGTKKMASTIKRNAKHLLDLINQLLDLSQLEEGKLKLNASKSNIIPLIKGIAMSFESIAERKDITLKVIPEKEQIELYFDKEKMTQIMTNLLSNAFKFTPEGGQIAVSVSETDNNKIRIKVRDSGIGVSDEELSKLFDRFYQVDCSHTREYEGTGIGLALTKELVELHHGTISVTSEIGKGTEFVIELLLGRKHLKDKLVVATEAIVQGKFNVGKEDFVSTEVEKVNETHVRDKDKNIILVVEDNADVREYIKDSLRDDFQIEEASNGEQGKRKAENIIPDLIISDIWMPKMGGNELTRILKTNEKTSHIPIILLTAKSEQQSKLEGLETGADAYLTKPFDIKELQIRINNLIKIRRKLQEKYSKVDFISPKKIEEKKISNLEELFICKVMEVIENHLSEEEFSIEQFSKEVGMSRVQLHRKLKALSGKSASNYLRSVRLSKAKQMIEEQKGNISEIAYLVGFSSPQYFSRSFKKEFGFPPSDLNT